jgi:3-oxoacyl-[acyl-carrier-protein] synthase-3
LNHVPAFDLGAVCTGFIYGLVTAAGLLQAGLAGCVLLIGADTFSTILNPADRSSAVVFGDGAGAVVLRCGNAGEPGALLAFDLGSDGNLSDVIVVRAGGSRHPLAAGQMTAADHWFSMQGKAVYRHATRRMSASARAVLRRVGWRPEDVDCFVGHQANGRILEAVGRDIGIAPERVFVNVDRVGNTVAASIPLALADATATGVLKSGHKVVLTAFGGGTTWGSAALTWPEL